MCASLKNRAGFQATRGCAQKGVQTRPGSLGGMSGEEKMQVLGVLETGALLVCPRRRCAFLISGRKRF